MLKILDTSPEERFDRITRLARHLFDVPIAAINFIDANREWRKSCQGPPNQIPRAISFCARLTQWGRLMIRPKQQFSHD